MCRVHHAKCKDRCITNWNQDCWEKYQQLQTYTWYHCNGRSEGELKSFLMKVKEESKKAGLKLHIQKNKMLASSPISSWQTDEEKMESDILYFHGLQNHCGPWLQPWNQKTLAHWQKSNDKPKQYFKKLE